MLRLWLVRLLLHTNYTQVNFKVCAQVGDEGIKSCIDQGWFEGIDVLF